MATKDRHASPRVINAVAARVGEMVTARLKHADSGNLHLPDLRSPRQLSSDELLNVTACVEHFMKQLGGSCVTEAHLNELTTILSESFLAARRREAAARAAAAPAAIPTKPSPRKHDRVHQVRDAAELVRQSVGAVMPLQSPDKGLAPSPPRAAHSNAADRGAPEAAVHSPRQALAAHPHETTAQPRLPPLNHSPRQQQQQQQQPVEHIRLLPPYGTADSSPEGVEKSKADLAAQAKEQKARLATMLDEQVKEKAALREAEKRHRQVESVARLGEMQQQAHLEADAKVVKKRLNQLQGEEYHRFVRMRDIDERKSRLENLLNFHVERKQAAAQRLAEIEVEAKRQKQLVEANILHAQIVEEEARRRAAEREAREPPAAPLVFGAPEEQAREKALQRKVSLARGLEKQMIEKFAQEHGLSKMAMA